MKKLSGLALCKAKHIEWTGDDGMNYDGMLMTPLAGKIPHKRILYIPFLSGIEIETDGNYYLISFLEMDQDVKLGRQFQWLNGGKVEEKDLQIFIQKLGPPAVINAENGHKIREEKNDLEMAKLIFETERKYFKWKAHLRHLVNELNSLNSQKIRQCNDYQETNVIYYENKINTIRNKITEIHNQINILNPYRNDI
ncbi:MAG: hypothetical protein KDC52_15015 [Ignavibacteriae bacterium]|nr:hypothetical protein [Saprospiraceae bacterium]MCB0752780.1 hypothetical protein [Ignavibacteriota bacterium]